MTTIDPRPLYLQRLKIRLQTNPTPTLGEEDYFTLFRLRDASSSITSEHANLARKAYLGAALEEKHSTLMKATEGEPVWNQTPASWIHGYATTAQLVPMPWCSSLIPPAQNQAPGASTTAFPSQNFAFLHPSTSLNTSGALRAQPTEAPDDVRSLRTILCPTSRDSFHSGVIDCKPLVSPSAPSTNLTRRHRLRYIHP